VLAAIAERGAQAGDYALAYRPGARDAAGHFMGGTELRLLVAHRGRIYAGTGYWEDRPGAEGPQGAAILALDGPGAAWRVEHVFDTPWRQRMRDFTISALAGIAFATDGTGKALSEPASFLLASSWDLGGDVPVFSHDDASGAWTTTNLDHDEPKPDMLAQLRSFALHRDRVTGADRVFAGVDPHGVFSGVFDPTAPGRIGWGTKPEFDISAIPLDAFPGLADRLRISSFAECNGRLYAAIGQQIYERVDGPAPTWRLVYTNPRPGRSETGLRGLTPIADPAGNGEVLLAAVEGNAARLVRVDPRTGEEASELDLRDFLGHAWGGPVGYVIAAYNDMTQLRAPDGRTALAIGLEAFIPPRATLPGHRFVDVGYGKVEAGGWYLVRRADGHYSLREVTLPAPDDQSPLVAVRTILPSPFPGDAQALYLGGYDANKAAAHDTAWVVRGTIAAALSEPK
jgi:hypothetical protein